MSLSPSNYRVRTAPEVCIGCGLCVKRCPMGAIRLEEHPEVKNRIARVKSRNGRDEVELKNKTGKLAVVAPDLCVGCGVCAFKCSSKSLVLERRQVIEDPPANAREYSKQVVADFAMARTQPGKQEA